MGAMLGLVAGSWIVGSWAGGGGSGLLIGCGVTLDGGCVVVIILRGCSAVVVAVWDLVWVVESGSTVSSGSAGATASVAGVACG